MPNFVIRLEPLAKETPSYVNNRFYRWRKGTLTK